MNTRMHLLRYLKILPAVALLAAIALSLPACPGSTGIYPVNVVKNQQYGLGYVSDGSVPVEYTLEPLLLDVYEPIGAPETGKPAILLVHGGSFTEGEKEKEQIVEYSRYFASKGYVAFAMNYRLAQDNPPAPDNWGAFPFSAAIHAAMVDVKAGVRFIRANAGDYGVDANKIALLGESAGAIAAVSTAIADPEDYDQDGPDLPIPPQNNPMVSPRVQGYIHLWGNADHVLLKVDTHDPPVMIVHGTDDNQIGARFETSERFASTLDLFNVPYVFFKADGMGHGAWDYRYRLKGVKVLAYDFLNEHMLGKGDTSPEGEIGGKETTPPAEAQQEK